MTEPMSPGEEFALAQLQAKMFSTPPSDVMVGRYVLREKLGEGGFGEVFRALDPHTQRHVALKLLHDDGESHNASQRLLREARAIASLRHPNIVEFYEFGQTEREQFVVMEFIDGQTLSDWTQEPRSFEEVLDVFVPAGRALAYSHQRGIVHRDFKPTNVMIARDGAIKVLDFGLVRRAEGFTSGSGLTDPLTAPGQAVGTPAFMAPEQHMGGATTAAADQYAFCASLFFTLYGKWPIEAPNPLLMARAKYREQFNEVDTSLAPAWVHPILLRGLRARPDARYPDMESLLDALERKPEQRRRRRMIAAAATASGLAIVGAAVWAMMM